MKAKILLSNAYNIKKKIDGKFNKHYRVHSLLKIIQLFKIKIFNKETFQTLLLKNEINNYNI